MAVFGSLSVVYVPPPKTVRRTWRKRLLTWPWRPWVSTRVQEHPLWELLKDRDEVFVSGDTVYGTDAQLHKLKTLSVNRELFQASQNDLRPGAGYTRGPNGTIKWP